MHHSASARFVLVCLVALLVVACGDDDDSSTGTPDSGMTGCVPEGTRCPSGAPDMGAGFCGSCCYRGSNADRADAPEFRMAGLELEEPASLATTVVSTLLRTALDSESFNWLIKVDGASMDGDVTITTGFGARNDDNTFSFTMGAAPSPGPADRWNPVDVPATLSGDTLTAEPYGGTLTVPVFDMDGTTVTLELPLQGLQVVSATLSDERSCIGSRTATRYRNDQGQLQAYITVDSAKAGDVEVSETMTINLCLLIANMATAEGTCDTIDRAEWPIKPNALCNDTGCTDTCDPVTECNAWKLVGGFSAQAVEITN